MTIPQSVSRPLRRVAVTGMGAVTPLGLTMQETWIGIIEGMSVAGPVKRFDASRFVSSIAYEVCDFKFREDLLLPREKPFVSDAAQFGLHAVLEAWEQAGFKQETLNPNRTAVCMGVGMSSPDFDWYENVFMRQDWENPSIAGTLRFFPDQFPSIVARLIGAKGGITTIHTACASSGQGIGEAFETIAYGEADVVVTGGTDSMISPYFFAGFGLLGALSKRNDSPQTASRPFDRGRDGFVLSEGAAALVLEDYEHAVHRGATILGEVVGYGITESAYRITDLHPEGRGPIEAMQMALDQALVLPSSVGYVNAHGTSTLVNDRIEALAIAKVFGARIPVSSTKSMTGHMIAAAGAVELAICLKALEHQVLPPSINLPDRDPECRINLTAPTPTDASFDYALSNSVGFGGSNTALVVRKAMS